MDSSADQQMTLPGPYAGTFRGLPQSIAEVRHAVGEYLDGCPAADDVVLVLSELATNAVLHSQSGRGAFAVRVHLHPGHVRVEVEDLAGRPWAVRRKDDRPHGLDIVNVIAGGTGNWGVQSSACSRVVWARVPC